MVHGTVTEDGTGVPIAGARVQLIASDASVVGVVYSDTLGGFLLRPGRRVRVAVHVTHPFYATVRSSELNVRDGEIVALELRMARSAVPLEPMVVRTRREARLAGFYERMERPDGFGQFITPSDIKARPAARTTDLLRGMRGVEIILGDRRDRVQLITMNRVQGRCLPTIYVDGIPVQQSTQGGVDSFLTPEMLEGVEVYTTGGRSPPGLHADDACGIVAFWTRAPDGGERWNWLKLLGSVAGFAAIVLIIR